MFQALLPLSKYLKAKSIRIYDFGFALHSKVSVVILLTCTLLVSARQFFGQPIECMSDEKQLDYVNLFCWTMGTFILTDPLERAKKQSIAVGMVSEYEGTERLYMRYYQWVVMILLLQALIFFFPALVWKTWEGGLMGELCHGLERSAVPMDKESKDRRSKLLKFFSSEYSRIHRGYARQYFLCELFNLLICVLNITLMNVFFNGFWSTYSQAMSRIPLYNWEKWNEMSSIVFPKVTKCEFFKYGGSGSVSKFGALCVLPLNILNEKIFAFLYVWFLFLLVASAAHLTFRVIVTFSMSARVIITQCSVGHKKKGLVRQLLNDMSYAKWFLLMRIACNVNPVVFGDLLHDLSDLQKFKNMEISI